MVVAGVALGIVAIAAMTLKSNYDGTVTPQLGAAHRFTVARASDASLTLSLLVSEAHDDLTPEELAQRQAASPPAAFTFGEPQLSEGGTVLTVPVSSAEGTGTFTYTKNLSMTFFPRGLFAILLEHRGADGGTSVAYMDFAEEGGEWKVRAVRQDDSTYEFEYRADTRRAFGLTD